MILQIALTGFYMFFDVICLLQKAERPKSKMLNGVDTSAAFSLRVKAVVNQPAAH